MVIRGGQKTVGRGHFQLGLTDGALKKTVYCPEGIAKRYSFWHCFPHLLRYKHCVRITLREVKRGGHFFSIIKSHPVLYLI